jgi:DNA-binding GntR family transcriptional regulator
MIRSVRDAPAKRQGLGIVQPVTRADELAGPERGALEKVDDRQGSTLTASVYEQLRTELLTGRLRPGEKLGSEALRKRFNTGSSPVREALNRLLAEGLVSLEEQKGFRVAPISREELEELVSARIWIDGSAIADSMRRFKTSWEEALVIALHHLARTPRGARGDAESPDWEARHKAFHHALISGCENRWMMRTSEQLFDAAERYRLLALDFVPERNELDEHRALVEACIDRNVEHALELLRQHYGQTFKAIVSSGL